MLLKRASMRWLIYLAVFAAGFGAGAWRAARPGRGLFAAAVALPLLLLFLVGGYAGWLWVASPRVENFNDLAAATTAAVAAGMALIALVGGLFGAWFRRAGR